MKRSIIALLLLAMTFAMATPADARDRSVFRIYNGTDKYILVTAHLKSNILNNNTLIRPWCIVPFANDEHVVESADVTQVRAEVSAVGCQHTPKLLDRTAPVGMRHDVNGDLNFSGVVKYAGGVYTFSY